MDAIGFTPAAMRQGVVAEARMLAQEPLPGRAYMVYRTYDEHLFIYRNTIPISLWIKLEFQMFVPSLIHIL
jgi:hypothetical protein